MKFLIGYFFFSIALVYDVVAQSQSVQVINNTNEEMHVVFQIAEPGECESSNPNNGDNGGFLIDPQTTENITVPAGSTEEIIWASCSPRPQCCDHQSSIDNKVPLCITDPIHATRDGHHFDCNLPDWNPPCYPNTYEFRISITGAFSIEIVTI